MPAFSTLHVYDDAMHPLVTLLNDGLVAGHLAAPILGERVAGAEWIVLGKRIVVAHAI